MVQNVRERNIQVQKVWGETSSVQNVQLKKVRGAKRPGPKSQGAKHLGPKYQEAKRPGPKREGRNVQDLNVRMRNDLVRIVRERNVQDQKVRRRNILVGAKRPGPKGPGAKLRSLTLYLYAV